MEDRRDHRIPVVALVAAVLVLLGPVAMADGPDDDQFDFNPTTVVHTNTNGAVVSSDAQATTTGTAGSVGGGSDCRLEPNGTIGEIFVDSFGAQLDQGLDPYFLWCGNEMRGLVWLDPNAGGAAPALDPQTIAMHLRDQIPVPNADIRINPNRGLVGVDSWFWIDGYNGSPIEESTNAFGQRVEVEASVTRYEWSFGDGETLVAKTVGRSYPHRSQIRHVYERSSAGLASGYQVEVSFSFSVRYRIDGGGWIDLPGISRVAETAYPVRESQSVIEQ
ncbi:MAG: hypothetical protein M3P43_01305 [Actinomycetota bacterium]|nr:hypothetical protein [Actinomycetota bacterium]